MALTVKEIPETNIKLSKGQKIQIFQHMKENKMAISNTVPVTFLCSNQKAKKIPSNYECKMIKVGIDNKENSREEL